MKHALRAAFGALAFAGVAALPSCGERTAESSRTVTLESLLDEMVDYDSAAEFPDYTLRQTSSYDRRSTAPDLPGWFANNDGGGYERIEQVGDHREKVLFEADGPGAVTRIWMTTWDKNGKLRFYFDNEEEPRLVIDAYDMSQAALPVGEGLSLRHTNYEERQEGRGGNTFMLPLPYAQHCRITFEEPDFDRFVARYYQINYRTYAPGTRVESFTPAEAGRLAGRIAEVDSLLLRPRASESGRRLAKSAHLEGGDALTLPVEGRDEAIRTLRIRLRPEREEDYASLMRTTIVRLSFDGEECVWAPLGDFAGAGMGAPEVRSWYLDCDGRGGVESRWVMPYRQQAVLTVENLSDKAATVEAELFTDAYRHTPATLRFRTTWRQERGIPVSPDYDSADNLDWSFALLEGGGVLRGDLLSLYNDAPDWYGEGDEKIWIDDEGFPSHFGTGTEDYYNCSWAPVVPFQTPFGGAPRADEASSHGYNAFMRTRNLDAIPFRKRLRFDLEMLSWHPGTVDYSTTVWWYGRPGSRAEGASGAAEALVPLR